MASKYSYKFTEKAERDLDSTLSHIKFDLKNPSAAAAFGKKVFDAVDNIREFPLSGMIVENDFLSNKDVRRVIVDNYVMYYTANDDEKTIYIIGIVYGKRNLEDILKYINE